MLERILIQKGSFHDSARLMRLSRDLRRLPGVISAEVLMATEMNRELLGEAGYKDPALDVATPMDLVVALRGDDAEALDAVEAELGRLLVAVDSPSAGGAFAGGAPAAADLREALALHPEINLVTIAVPGAYAAFAARQALEAGRHVFLFSDNVAIEDEVALKTLGAEAGLLVMGPDCGTAILAGVGIGFANRVRRGGVGLVGASGTGIQDISSMVHQAGAGVSQAIGTGSRDLSEAVGGIMTIMGVRLLAEDPDTRVIVLVAKGPHAAVAERLHGILSKAGKPVVVRYLGQTGAGERDGVLYTSNLDEASWAAVTHLDLPESPSVLCQGAMALDPSLLEPGAGRLVGLFGGGSLASEAALILKERGHPTESPKTALSEGQVMPGAAHLVVDVGDDAYTVGKPHPMVDQTTRCALIRAAGADRSVGLLLIDLVLGDGAHPDPAPELAQAVKEARSARQGEPLAVVASITGTDLDPQGLSNQRGILTQAGIVVAPSASQAARLAAAWLDTAPERSRP